VSFGTKTSQFPVRLETTLGCESAGQASRKRLWEYRR
jgi:hypothetical protein